LRYGLNIKRDFLGERRVRAAWLYLLLLVLFSGCATSGKYKEKVSSWMGSTEQQLIDSWGPPQSTYTSGSKRYLTYNSSRSVFLPGSSPTYTTTVYGNTAYTNSTGGYPDQNIRLSCTTTFTSENGRLVSWRFKGNDCTSK